MFLHQIANKRTLPIYASKRNFEINKPSWDPSCVTLTNHALTEEKKNPTILKDLTLLLCSIQTAAKVVSSAVRNAGTFHLFGSAGKTNIQGEEVKKLDVLANELFVNLLKASHTTCILVSEEEKDIVLVESEKQGRYIVCFDPLDGSSNIDCLVSVGTIFVIFRKDDDYPPSVQHVLQSGNNAVAAGYVLYSSATVMVLSIGGRLDGFMLDPSIGEFILTDKDMKIPHRGNIYSINEAHEHMWDVAVREYVQSKKGSCKDRMYGSRYVGCMVADVHRTIKYGGIYMYPASVNDKKGKLRLLYECIPMAYIITRAGGLAYNGREPILDVVPEHIHERSPIFLGSKEDVEELLTVLAKHKST